jgi:translation elongation factor EF-G
VRQALADGVIAGFPVEDLRVIVYDGKTHAVDGKEVAFVTAGRKATVEAIRAANPIVLEPIVGIEIVSPGSAIGDLTGDLSSRRGHITGTNPRPGNTASITGEVPLAEIADYASRLKSMTGGQGAYSIEFAATRRCRRKCSRSWRRPSGRGKRRSEAAVARHLALSRCRQRLNPPAAVPSRFVAGRTGLLVCSTMPWPTSTNTIRAWSLLFLQAGSR